MKFAPNETMVSGNAFEALKNIAKNRTERRATMVSTHTPQILAGKTEIMPRQTQLLLTMFYAKLNPVFSSS